jgi:hypothetical protein
VNVTIARFGFVCNFFFHYYFNFFFLLVFHEIQDP